MNLELPGNVVQWQVRVSQDTDSDAREYLRLQGTEETEISALVEDAVQAYLLRRTIQDIHARNSDTSPEELQDLADAAVRSVRREMSTERA